MDSRGHCDAFFKRRRTHTYIPLAGDEIMSKKRELRLEDTKQPRARTPYSDWRKMLKSHISTGRDYKAQAREIVLIT